MSEFRFNFIRKNINSRCMDFVEYFFPRDSTKKPFFFLPMWRVIIFHDTWNESSNRYLEMRAISYSRLREKKEREEDVWSLKRERETRVRKICYKTAIHGKNITVQEKKEKKKKMWRCRENPIGITTDARIIKLASRRCRLEISPREPIIPSDWRSSSTAFSRSSFSPPLFLILACLRTSLARTLKM